MMHLTANQAGWMIFTAIALVLWPLLMRYLSYRVRGTRERMLELGNFLLENNSFEPKGKLIVGMMLEDASDWRFMAAMSFRFPVYVVGRLFNMVEPVKLPSLPKDEEFKSKFYEFFSCHMRSTAAANPIFSIIVAFEFALLVMILLPLGMLSLVTEYMYKISVLTERNTHLNHT